MGEKIKNLSIYKGFLKLKETLKPMTFTEKIQHIFYSYKAEMYIAALIIFVFVFFVSCIITANTKLMIAGDLVNLSISEEGLAYLTDDYLERLGGEKFLRKFSIEEIYFTMTEDSDSIEYNYQSSAQTLSRMVGGMLGFQLLSKAGLELFIGEGFYMDLRKFMTEEELAQWEGKIVYIEYEGTTERVPVALDISETAFAKDCMPMYGPYFFTVVYTTPRLQETRDFFDYLLAWEENKAVTEPTG